jgi:hypothetical protein
MAGLAMPSAGTSNATSTPMIAITTNSSTPVTPSGDTMRWPPFLIPLHVISRAGHSQYPFQLKE